MGGPHARRVPPAVLVGSLLLGLVAVSGAAVLVRLAPDVPAPSAAFWRLAGATAVLGAVALARAGLRGVRAALAGRGRTVLLAGAFLGAHFGLWFASLHRTSVATSVVLVTTSPIQAALYERLVLRERLGAVRGLGIALGVVGAIWLALAGVGGGGRDTLLGDGLALGGASAAAGYFLAGRRARGQTALLPYVMAVYGVGALTVLVLVVVLRLPLAGFAPRSYAAVAALALLPQLVGHTLFNWALRHVTAASVAAVTLGEPVGAAALAAILLGERPAALALVGGAISLAGVALVLAGAGGRLDPAAARLAAEPVPPRA